MPTTTIQIGDTITGRCVTIGDAVTGCVQEIVQPFAYSGWSGPRYRIEITAPSSRAGRVTVLAAVDSHSPAAARRMTKTEAAEVLGIRVRVASRRNGRPVTKDLVEEIMNEAHHWTGLFPAAAASGVSWRTVLCYARRDI